MTTVLVWNEERYALQADDMDKTHQAFVALVNQTANASKDDFVVHLQRLLEHTQQHFAYEEQLMQTSAFPATGEHKAEHQRILGELQHLVMRSQQGRTSLARAYVKEKLPEWFNLHVVTVDSALAAHLKKM